MDNLAKDSAAELRETQKPAPQNHFDRLVDTLPGTSGYCTNFSDNHSKDISGLGNAERTDGASLHSIESFVCRFCHNNENPEKLISPCLCKGSLTYVHIDCLERWISMSRCTTCELCQFQYNTEQALRYTLYQSLSMWYSRSMSRRALQEDCQMFLLLTLIAFGIVGTLLVAVQYYILQGNINGLGRVWTKVWLIFFLFTTLIVYLINVYMIIKAQLMPWYRWWQSARDIRLILENHKPAYESSKQIKNDKNANSSTAAKEESISQAARMCCQQRDHGTLLRNDEHQQGGQGDDPTCQCKLESMNFLCVSKNNKCSEKIRMQIDLGKIQSKLKMIMFDISRAAATRIALNSYVPLEPAHDGLILIV